MKTVISVGGLILAFGGALYLGALPPAGSNSNPRTAPLAALENPAPPARDLSRIVATDGALTEIVYALGYGDKVVAADSTALWPPAAAKKPSIGYVRQLSAEGILSLAPTLVITSAEAGPPNVIDQLRNSGIPLLDIPGEKMNRSFPAALARITAVAEGLGAAEQGRALARDVEADLEAVRKAAEGRKRQKALFLFNVTQDKITAGGKGTGADEFFKLAGLENVAGDLDGWKPFSQEALVASAPEILVACFTRSHQEQYKTAGELLTVHGLAQTPAGKNKRVFFVDSVKFLSGGPRAGEMALEFARMIHPDLELPPPRSAPWFRKAEELYRE